MPPHSGTIHVETVTREKTRGDDDRHPLTERKSISDTYLIESVSDNKTQFRKAVAHIALSCFMNNRFCTTIEDVESIFDSFSVYEMFPMPAEPVEKDAKKALHSELVLNRMLLSFYFEKNQKNRTGQQETVEFYHLTLMEYLAAEAMASKLLLLIERDSDRRNMYTDGELLFLFFMLFGNRHMSNQMAEDFEGHVARILDSINAENIKSRLLDLAPKWIEAELLPKDKKFHNAKLYTWGKYSDERLTEMNWKTASRLTHLTYLALLDLFDVKQKYNEYLEHDKVLHGNWWPQFRDALSEIRGNQLMMKSLKSLYLRGADLSGVQLSSADLSSADLSEADMSGSKFSYSNLSGAKFSRANLRKSNLIGANLSFSDLRRARLNGAELKRAKLNSADLSGADLSSAVLNGAAFNRTIIYEIPYHEIEFPEKHRESFDKLYSFIMDRPEDARPFHPPLSFEEHVEHWRNHWSGHPDDESPHPTSGDASTRPY